MATDGDWMSSWRPYDLQAADVITSKRHTLESALLLRLRYLCLRTCTWDLKVIPRPSCLQFIRLHRVPTRGFSARHSTAQLRELVNMDKRFSPRMHVGREELYTDLEARIRYLHSFLDFGSQDIAALQSCAKYFKQLVPAVVNIVYKKLLQYDITARALATRSTSYTGPLPEGGEAALSEDSPQIQHRKLFLRAYLMKLCSDPAGTELWEYLDKVGMMHVGLGRAHPLHVEYVHLGLTLGFIHDILVEAILSHPKLSLPRKTAFLKALGKVIWIQNDLLAKWHVRDGDDVVPPPSSSSSSSRRGAAAAAGKNDNGDDAATVVVPEREGYLHGKRVLDTLDDDDHDEDDDGFAHPDSPSRIPRPMAAAGACPFSGMGARASAAGEVEEEVVAWAPKEKATSG